MKVKKIFTIILGKCSSLLDDIAFVSFRNELRKEAIGNKYPCFIVAMPEAIHLTICAFSRIPEKTQIIVLANGCSQEEVRLLKIFGKKVLRIGRTLSHGRVLSAIISIQQDPFWILDHDCFILDYSLIEESERRNVEPQLGQAFFSNPEENALGLPDFGTFLMLLNPESIRAIVKTFNAPLGITTWEEINAPIARELLKMGIRRNSYPTWKPYFDTFRLINCLALTSNAQFKFSRSYSFQFHKNDEVVHFGHTSKPFFTNNADKRYFNIGALISAVLLSEFQKPFPEYQSQVVKGLPPIEVMSNSLQNSKQLNPMELSLILRIQRDFANYLKGF